MFRSCTPGVFATFSCALCLSYNSPLISYRLTFCPLAMKILCKSSHSSSPPVYSDLVCSCGCCMNAHVCLLVHLSRIDMLCTLFVLSPLPVNCLGRLMKKMDSLGGANNALRIGKLLIGMLNSTCPILLPGFLSFSRPPPSSNLLVPCFPPTLLQPTLIPAPYPPTNSLLRPPMPPCYRFFSDRPLHWLCLVFPGEIAVVA